VVSLFLPHTVVLGDSGTPSPERSAPPALAPAVVQLRLGENKQARGLHARTPSGAAPVSIVEDLKDKVRFIPVSCPFLTPLY
jgi:hypothetical protein